MNNEDLERYEIESIKDDGKKTKPLKIRVTFPSGKIICYTIVERTFIETLKEIGSERFPDIQIKIGKNPLVAKEKIAKYGESMKPVVDGWYVNTQSDTRQKYMQLIAIKNQLNLDINIEIGNDFQAVKSKDVKYRRRDLRIKATSDKWEISLKPEDTYIAVLKQIGFDRLAVSPVRLDDMKIVTPTKQYQSQRMVGNYWVTFPRYTRHIIKWLRTIILITKSNIKVQEDYAETNKFTFVNKKMKAQVGDIIMYDSNICSVLGIRKSIQNERLVLKNIEGAIIVEINDIERYVVLCHTT